MLRIRFVALLQLRIHTVVREAVLARQNPPVPFEPTEAEPSPLQEYGRKPAVEVPFRLAAENSRLARLLPSAFMQVEKRREQAVQLLDTIHQAEARLAAVFEISQHGTHLTPE